MLFFTALSLPIVMGQYSPILFFLDIMFLHLISLNKVRANL